jgi:hypothetical protein
MISLKRSPEYKKIVPIVAIAFLRGDKVMAQSVQPVAPLPPPNNTQPSIDPVTAIGYILAAGAATFALLPKLVERWFGRVLESNKNKEDLQTLVLKSQAELELDQKQKELDNANNLANFYLETARESHKSERTLLMTFVSNQLTASAQKDDQLYSLINNQEQIINRLIKIEERLTKNEEVQHDIMNVLNMRKRGSDEFTTGDQKSD